MILFLDFDGVLHPEPCYREEEHFAQLPRLETVLRAFADVDIVISSTWRHTHDLHRLRACFSDDIALRVIDVTPQWREVAHLIDVVGSYVRQVEIEGWLREHRRPWEPWVALDDRHYLFRPFLPNLVRCNPQTGMDAQVEARLREKLGGAR